MLQNLFNNVEYPCPNRRLKHIISVPVRGKRLCWHRYSQKGFHEELVDTRREPKRISIRHYTCLKCARVVHVYGPGDQHEIERTLKP